MDVPGLLARLDRISPTKLRTTNLLISLFVLLPHIAAYFLAKPGEITGGPFFWSSIAVLDAIAVFVLIGCLTTYRDASRIPAVLKAQSVALSVLVIPLLLWGLGYAVLGTPAGNFSFNPILYAFLCAYPIYLLRRFVLDEHLSSSWVLGHAHVITAMLALIIGAVIVIHFYQQNFW